MNLEPSYPAKIAYLEFINDQLQAELDDLNYLLQAVGFSEGLKTVRTVVKEMIQEDEFADD